MFSSPLLCHDANPPQQPPAPSLLCDQGLVTLDMSAVVNFSISNNLFRNFLLNLYAGQPFKEQHVTPSDVCYTAARPRPRRVLHSSPFTSSTCVAQQHVHVPDVCCTAARPHPRRVLYSSPSTSATCVAQQPVHVLNVCCTVARHAQRRVLHSSTSRLEGHL